MNLVKTCSALALTIAFFSVSTTLGQSVVSAKNLPNFSKINDQLYRGGQPSQAGINELARLGIKTVIDLRDNDDRAKSEGQWAGAAGMRFINIPLSTLARPKDETIAAILADIMAAKDQPVFVHCKRGSDRTGTVIAVYRIVHDGWNGQQTMSEARQFGIGWWQFWMKDFINDYYRDHKRQLQPDLNAR